MTFHGNVPSLVHDVKRAVLISIHAILHFASLVDAVSLPAMQSSRRSVQAHANETIPNTFQTGFQSDFSGETARTRRTAKYVPTTKSKR